MANVVDLAECIRSGNTEALTAELAANPARVSERAPNGISLLQFAAYCRSEASARILMSHLPEMDIHEACCWGDVDRVKTILRAYPAAANLKSADGFGPLGLACFFDHEWLVDVLLEAGADVNAASDNAFKVTPLHSASAISNLGIVRKLLEAGADVNARQDRGATALHSAAYNGRKDIVDLLLSYGADRTAKTVEGKTPMDFASEKGFQFGS